MPTKGKSYKKRGSRKPSKKTATYGRKERVTGTISRFNSKDPFPPTRVVNLTYTGNNVIGSGVLGVYGVQRNYALNGLFAPDLVGGAGAHQPYGFDEMALLYTNYKVLSCHYHIEFVDPGADGSIAAVCVLAPEDAYTLTGKDPMMGVIDEKPMAKTKVFNNTGNQKAVFSGNIPISVAMGLTKLQFMTDIDRSTALVTANPSYVPKIIASVGAITQLANQLCTIRTRLTYKVQFYGRRIKTQS